VTTFRNEEELSPEYKMKVTIDREGCIECGVCESICPDVFELRNNEKARIVAKFRQGDNPAIGSVPDEQVACSKEAEDSCPVLVIKTE
jgi:ferredoxin